MKVGLKWYTIGVSKPVQVEVEADGIDDAIGKLGVGLTKIVAGETNHGTMEPGQPTRCSHWPLQMTDCPQCCPRNLPDPHAACKEREAFLRREVDISNQNAKVYNAHWTATLKAKADVDAELSALKPTRGRCNIIGCHENAVRPVGQYVYCEPHAKEQDLFRQADTHKACLAARAALNADLDKEREKSSGPALTVPMFPYECNRIGNEGHNWLKTELKLRAGSGQRHDVTITGPSEVFTEFAWVNIAEPVAIVLAPEHQDVTAWRERAEKAETMLTQIRLRTHAPDGLTPYGAVNHAMQIAESMKDRAERAEAASAAMTKLAGERAAKIAEQEERLHTSEANTKDGLRDRCHEAEQATAAAKAENETLLKEIERLRKLPREKSDHSGCQRELQRVKEARNTDLRRERDELHRSIDGHVRARQEADARNAEACRAIGCCSGDLVKAAGRLRAQAGDVKAKVDEAVLLERRLIMGRVPDAITSFSNFIQNRITAKVQAGQP